MLTCLIAGGLVVFGCHSSTVSSSKIEEKSVGAVHVTKEPLWVSREFFDRDIDMSKSWAEEHNQSANTHWRFSCIPKFEFDLTSQQSQGKNVTVKVKIKSVQLALGAPVVIYLPKYATPDVVSHEDGHVKICQRIYDSRAVQAALDAGASVIGKEFEGTDTSVEGACQNALLNAGQAIGREYRANTLVVLGRLSAFYDHFAPQHPQAAYVDDCIEGAFKAEKMFEDGKLDFSLRKTLELHSGKASSSKIETHTHSDHNDHK